MKMVAGHSTILNPELLLVHLHCVIFILSLLLRYTTMSFSYLGDWVGGLREGCGVLVAKLNKTTIHLNDRHTKT